MTERSLPPWRRLLPWALVVAALVALAFSRVNLVGVLVDGIQIGAVYSMVGLGLVLVYRATGVLNFAQGEFGTIPAFVVLAILLGGDFTKDVDPTAVSGFSMAALTLLAVLIGAGLAVLVNVVVIQRLAEASPVTSLVATAGVALLLAQGQILVFETQLRKFPRYIDGVPCLASEDGVCTSLFRIGGAVIPWHTFIVIFVLGLAAVLLALFFRSRAGVALLATSQEPFAASLQGISVRTMSMLAWATAGGLAALGGVLGAGVFENIFPGLMTATFLIPAFTGAVLGGLTSMTGAVAGGILLGITVSMANSFAVVYNLTSAMPGPPQIATFVVLLAVLLVRPQGLLGKGA